MGVDWAVKKTPPLAVLLSEKKNPLWSRPSLVALVIIIWQNTSYNRKHMFGFLVMLSFLCNFPALLLSLPTSRHFNKVLIGM